MIIEQTRRALWALCATVVMATTACGPEAPPVEEEPTPCTRRQDCTEEGERCGDEGVCVEEVLECDGDVDCGFGEYCKKDAADGAGTCEDYTCEGDDACGAGTICEQIGDGLQCSKGCRQDTDCGGDEFVCQVGECVAAACTVGSCAPFEKCEQAISPATCVPDGTCANDGHCASYGAFIDDGNAYVCDGGSCIERPPCDPNRDPDNIDADCRFIEGEICDNGTCRDGCRRNQDCPLNEVCNPQSFQCERTCLTSEDCPAIVGDVAGNYECITNPDPNISTNICIETCNTEDDCDTPGQICRASGVGEPRVCQGCLRNDQCPGDQVCNFELGSTPEEIASDMVGLCEAAPPLCPPDTFGNNHSPVTTQDGGVTLTPYPVPQVYPFVADGRVDDTTGPFFCDENVQGEWYQIDGVAPGQVISVTIEYQTGGANLDVALYTSDQTQLVAATRPPDIEGGTDELRWGTPAGGTFLIQVRGTTINPRVPYSLTIDVADPAACVDDALEENDTAASAKPLDEGVEYRDLQVCSSLGGATTTDKDFFTLDVAANQVVEIIAQAERRLGDVDMFITAPDGTPLAAETVGDVERLEFLSTDAGSYLVEVVVRGGIGNVDYIIEWDQVDNDCYDPFEVGTDNNDICSAASLVDSQTYSDLRLCTDGDFYQIDLLPEEKLTARACYDPRVSAGFVDLRLRGPEQAQCAVILEYDTRVDGDTPGIICQQVVFDADRGGSYYLAATLNQGVNVQYDLEIDIEEGPPCIEDRFEQGGGNDDVASAPVLDPTSQADLAIPGLQYCDTNEDFFAVDLLAGQVVEWRILHKAAVGDLDAEIIDPNGNAVAFGQSTDDDEIVTLPAGAPADGRYTLRIYGKFPDRVGYQLQMYVDGVGPADPVCPDVFENNDTRADAVELAEGSYNLLVCGTPDDKDWYRTLLEPGETIDLTTTFNSASGNVDVKLYKDGTNGAEIASTTGTQSPKVLTYTATQQEYVVYRVNTYAGVESTSYQLDVAVTDAPPCVDDLSEDNDSGADALGVSAPGLYSRLAKCEGDEDWYRFDVTEGRNAEAYINFDGARADLDIIVYSDAAGTNEIGRSEGNGSGESVTFTAATDPDAATTKTYWVQVVSKVPARGNYDLMLYQDTDGDGTAEGPADRVCPDRYEQNDTSTTPFELGVGAFDDLLLCWGGGANDSDYYSVFVPGNATLTADLTFAHASGDIQARLYQVDATTGIQRLVGAGTSSDDDESVSHTNGAQGATYVLQVFSSQIPQFKNYYDLAFSLAFSDVCPEDAVSARSQATVAGATAPDAYAGLVMCESTEDWFQIDANSGDTIFAGIELNKRFGDLDLEIYDDMGALLASSDGADNIEELSYVAGYTGAHFLRVLPKGGAFVRNVYDLYVSSGASVPAAPYCPDPYERNDSLEQAVSLNFTSQNLFDDPVACGEDEDWYQLSLSSGQTYQFAATFEHSAAADIDIELFDDSGTSLAVSDSDTNDEFFTYRPTANGTYYLKASNTSATPGESPYGLYLNRENGPCVDDAYEPNNTFGSAFGNRFMAPGTYALSNCYISANDSTPEDYFAYTVQSSGDVTITLANEASIVDLQLFVNFQPATPSGNNRQTYTVSGANAGDNITIYVFNNGTSSGPYSITIAE